MVELREVVEQQSAGQFRIGDRALEVEPVRSRGRAVGDAEFSVQWSLTELADDIEDEYERFAAVRTPPEGKSRWTPDDASRRVGRQVELAPGGARETLLVGMPSASTGF